MAPRRRTAAGLALRTSTARVTGARTAGFSRIAPGEMSREMPVSELLGILADAEKEKSEFSAVGDLR